MERRASIKDVAKRAGVSPATVSNALNHPERVKPGPMERIQQAIAALHYVRSEPARHLRSGRSHAIGLLLLDTGNPEFTRMADGVEDALADDGWTVLMGSSRRDVERERRYLRSFSENQAAGIIITPRDGVAPELERINERGTPVVLLDRSEAGTRWNSVSVDDYHGGRIAAEHLVGLGHRHIAFVGTLDAADPVRERFSGVCQGIDDASGSVRIEQWDADLTMRAGREVGYRIATSRVRPTAVIAAIDMLAFGILQAFTQEGLLVPQDISLCGYDDTELAAQLATPLTSVHRPHYDIGHSAGEMLLQLLDGKAPPSRHLRYEPRLVLRQSTGAPPAV